MKYLPLLLLPLIVWGCSTPKFINYKDKSYYAGHEPKKSLYMFPVSSITYGEPGILNRTPYWAIIEKEDYTRKYYYK